MRLPILLTAALLVAGPCVAQDTTAQDIQSSDWSACLPLQIGPEEVKDGLQSYDVVFGKRAIEWEKADYDQLIALVTACNGVGFEDGTMVSGPDWMKMIGGVMKTVYATSAIHQQIMEWAAAMPVDAIRLPECGDLAKYVPPGRDLKDNSAEIFGVPLYGMTDNDLTYAIEHINNCMAFLPDEGLDAFGISRTIVSRTVTPMMDRALLVQIRTREYGTTAWPPRFESDIVVEFDGYEVPPSFLTDEGIALVKRYNRAASRPRGMTLDAVYNIMAFSSQLLDNFPPDIDRAYAEAIQEKLSDNIFQTTGTRPQQ